jgi:hypothetical protein
MGRTRSCKCGAVHECFMRLSEIVQELRSTQQLFSMDETGNGIRPEQARHKLVVCSKWTSARGYYRDVSDVTHVSVVATPSLSNASPKLMFLTVLDVHHNDYGLCIQNDLSVSCRNSKGYMTSESMIIDLNQIVKRYLERHRREHNDDRLPVYFVMDNCATHNRPEHLRLMASLLMHPV